MVDLRKLPESCDVRMPGVCIGDGAVLAHVRLSGISGMGLKAPDLLAAHACTACHDEYDRRTKRIPKEDAQRWFYEGVLRTQYRLIRDEVVTWGD